MWSLVGRHSQGPPRLRPAPVGFLLVVDHLLGDPVLRPDHAGAEGGKMGVGSPAVIHGNGIKPGGAERDRVREPVPPDGAGSTPRVRRCRTWPGTAAAGASARGARVQGNGVERLRCRSGVRRPGGRLAAAPSRKTSRFPSSGAWTSRASAQPVQVRRRPAKHLSELEHQEGPLLDAGRRRPCRGDREARPRNSRKRPGETEGVPCRVPQGEAVQHQPDRQEFDQAAGRYRANHPVAAQLRAAGPCRPSRAGRAGWRRESLSHSVLGHAQEVEGFPDRFERA